MFTAKVGFGTTPFLTPAGLVPKPYALRLFVTATRNGYAVLPGGLAMTVDPDKTVALSAPDGESRDVWVVSDGIPAPFTGLWRPTIEAARIHRVPEELPSRAAENLFWLGRYAERADWTMRVLRTSLSRLQEDSDTRQGLQACRTALEGPLCQRLPADLSAAGRRSSRGPTRPTPGFRSGRRRRDGSISIPPMGSCLRTSTSRSPAGATTPT